MAKFPFPSDPRFEAIVLAYVNKKLIADLVLPRKMVAKQEFKYLVFDKSERMTIPDTKVGRKSYPNQVEFTGSDATESTVDYALEDVVPQSDIDNAPDGFDPEANAIEGLTDLVMLSREKRTADLVFAAANYATANKLTLSGTDQISDYANSDPIGVIDDAKDSMLMEPNILVIDRLGWSKLRKHPAIVSAALGNSGVKGIISRRAVADLFELDDILVGASWLNTAKKGQAASYSKVWGKHAALIYQDLLADTTRRTTYGYTAQFGNKVATSNPDIRLGLTGGVIPKVGESVKELIVANDLGYLITDFIA